MVSAKLSCGCEIIAVAHVVDGKVDINDPKAFQVRLEWCAIHANAHELARVVEKVAAGTASVADLQAILEKIRWYKSERRN